MYKEMQIWHPLTEPGQCHLKAIHFTLLCICCGTDFFKKNQLWSRKGAGEVIDLFCNGKALREVADNLVVQMRPESKMAWLHEMPCHPADVLDERYFTIDPDVLPTTEELKAALDPLLPPVLTPIVLGYADQGSRLPDDKVVAELSMRLLPTAWVSRHNNHERVMDHYHELFRTVRLGFVSLGTVKPEPDTIEMLLWNLHYWMVDWNKVHAPDPLQRYVDFNVTKSRGTKRKECADDASVKRLRET